MLARLALKEIRETAWIAGLALAAYVYQLSTLMGREALYSQVNPPWQVLGSYNLAIVAVCLAIVLGLRQTLGESAFGTFQFLLSRPPSRRQLIGTKLMVGAGVYLAVAAMPVIVYGSWVATPGKYPGPFEWSMTAPAWKALLGIILVYLGAFFVGIRPGRWYGTRLLPLVATGVLTMPVVLMPRWWITGLPAMVLLGVLLVAAIFRMARIRDFS